MKGSKKKNKHRKLKKGLKIPLKKMDPIEIERLFSLILERLNEIETFKPRTTNILSKRSFFNSQEKLVFIRYIETLDEDDEEIDKSRDDLLFFRMTHEEFLRRIEERN